MASSRICTRWCFSSDRGDAAQHLHRRRLVRLLDLHHLEAAGEGRVLLDILLVLRPGGRRDGAELAARERGLQQVGGVAGARGAAGADQRVRLVDEEDDRRLGGLHLLDHRPQPLLELALHARARLHQPDVEHPQAHVLAASAARRPRASRSAKPSTTAVLPTPASPVRIGLFCRRRISTSMIWRISGSRPTTGSILPVPGARGEVGGVLRQRRVAAGRAPRRRFAPAARRRRARPRSSRRARRRGARRSRRGRSCRTRG